jgi:uncharacterized membrane protein YqaE (UPF0057 family)
VGGFVVSRPAHDSAVSVGVRWAQRMMAIGFEFALPPLVGFWLDGRLRSGHLLTITGAILGFLSGMLHLVSIVREAAKANASTTGPTPGRPPREKSDGSNESGWADHG